MKKTMLATVLGLALMPLTFAAQTPAKPATDSQSNTATSTAKPKVKKHKKHARKPVAKTNPAAQPNAVKPATPATPQK
jgi:hypothetical protein